MASSKSFLLSFCWECDVHSLIQAAKLATPASAPAKEAEAPEGGPLPETLVRIPTEHAPTLHAQTENMEAAAAEDASMASP